MREFIINNYYIVLGIAIFFFIALLGYHRDNKTIANKTQVQNMNGGADKKTVSISELEI
ncbi:MAG: hypothetical protein R3Y13_03315 [bacterium]